MDLNFKIDDVDSTPVKPWAGFYRLQTAALICHAKTHSHSTTRRIVRPLRSLGLRFFWWLELSCLTTHGTCVAKLTPPLLEHLFKGRVPYPFGRIFLVRLFLCTYHSKQNPSWFSNFCVLTERAWYKNDQIHSKDFCILRRLKHGVYKQLNLPKRFLHLTGIKSQTFKYRVLRSVN